MSEEPQCYDLKYMGGHVEYPKSSNCRFYLYENRVEIENPDLVIPYNAITGIENMDEKKISTQSSRTRISISPTIDNWYYVEKEKSIYSNRI